jgi:HSPB1-associated protein 1
MIMIDKNDFRNIVLNAKQPIVVKNSQVLHWPCLSMDFQEWAEHFDAEKATCSFDLGRHKFGSISQFERFRSTKTMKMTEFLSKCADDDEFWCCHNYKYLNDCPEQCRKGISFADLGFPEVDDDISFWVGKKGSHTPVHFDAYGCNIVVQVFGRKSWFLFPNESLAAKESRIPYEESSIYCTSNFYSPDPEHLSDFSGKIVSVVIVCIMRI